MSVIAFHIAPPIGGLSCFGDLTSCTFTFYNCLVHDYIAAVTADGSLVTAKVSRDQLETELTGNSHGLICRPSFQGRGAKIAYGHYPVCH